MSIYTVRICVWLCNAYSISMCIYMSVVVSDADAENANAPLPPCCFSLRNLWPCPDLSAAD